jgi:hypothetical protein
MKVCVGNGSRILKIGLPCCQTSSPKDYFMKAKNNGIICKALKEIRTLQLRNKDRTSQYKGVSHLNHSDLDMIALYIGHYLSMGNIDGLMKPWGSIGTVLRKLGIEM